MAPEGVASRPVRQVLTDHVYDTLLEMLMDGRYRPSESLSIDGLARELDVSATPVREALARLEVTGLVVRAALRGYRVAPLPTTAELGELMDARLTIEPVNAARACERVTPELIEALDRSISDLRTAPRGPEFAGYRDYWQADMRFHELIAEGAGNRFLRWPTTVSADRCKGSGFLPAWGSQTRSTPSKSTPPFWLRSGISRRRRHGKR